MLALGAVQALASEEDYQFGVHLSHKITPLLPVENFPTVIGLSIVLSPLGCSGAAAGVTLKRLPPATSPT